MFKRVLFSSMLAFIVGCSMMPLDASKKQEVNDVAVASLFEDSLPITYVGTTIYNNKVNRINIENWNLSEIILTETEAGLKASGKKFKKIQFNKDKIKQALEAGNTATKRMLGTTDEELNQYLFQAAVAEGAKYLFIYHPIKSDNFAQPKGFGLYCRAAFGSKGDWQAYTLFHVALWDLQTKSKIYQTAINPEDLSYNSGKPCQEINSTTPDKFALQFKEHVQLLAKKASQLTLKKSGLVN